ncbi:MAG: SAM-dependent methyltransferase [Betaproteobacteria bacterium]|nr:SAM-dependent methyltransferase [Betaproteobacteria bacterium]
MREDARPVSPPPRPAAPAPALPLPEADALAASAALLEQMRAEIAAAGGWIGFDRYMALALYAPGLGYYAGGAAKFGREGDFVTAPGLGPLYAQTLARSLAAIMARSAPHILEFGAGTGALAGDLLAELARLDAVPHSYAILEPSGALAARQKAEIARRAPRLAERVRWLDRLPAAFRGAMLANEVLDALPVRIVEWAPEGVLECGVCWADGAPGWAARPAQGELLEAAHALAAGHAIVPPYRTEIALAARGWMRSVAESLECGALLAIDYGFPAREYFHAQRSSGTLMCHYRHRAHGDPFFHPGLQDITAHVDFSALALAAQDAGLQVLGYATQAGFLIEAGITEVLARTDPRDLKAYVPLASAAQKLLSPAEMGELFKVLAVGRGLADAKDGSAALPGYARGDRSHTL